MNDALRRRFGDQLGEQIGHGGEARVYALRDDRVLRVFHGPRGDLVPLAAFYDEIAGAQLPFVLPQMLEHGVLDGLRYSVDVRIPGRPLMDALLELRGERRLRALDSYLAGAELIASIAVDRPYFGEVTRDDPVRAATWSAFLQARIDQSLASMRPHLKADVASLDDALAGVRRQFDALSFGGPARLVHGDYFPGNVMIGDNDAVTGVIDFGALTVMGDPMMDVASAVVFLEATRDAFDPLDVGYLTQRLFDQRGPAVLDVLRAYRGFYAIRLSNSKLEGDEHLYGWCVRSLEAFARDA